MSSDHADVYERSGGLEPQDSDMDIRCVSVFSENMWPFSYRDKQ